MKRVLALLLAGTLSTHAAAAATAIQIPIGPRAIALAGAYTSLADDATALFWNPAGLAQVGHQEFTASNANLFGTNIHDNFASFVLPFSPALAAATDWYHSGFDDGELGFRENRVDAGFGLELRPRWFVGANAKLMTRSLDLDATSLGAGRGYGFDLGVLGMPLDRLRIGATAQDVFGTHLRDNDGTSPLAYPRSLHAGASYAWRRWGTVVGQLDDRWHLGAEVVPTPLLAVRAGVQADRHDSEGPTWSCGLGLKAGVLRVDWAREFPPTLPGTDHFAATFEFNFNPPLVRLERPHVNDIYSSLERSYAKEPIGTLRVRNLQDRLLETQVSVFIPELMDKPSEQTVGLRPKAVTDVPLNAVLSDRVLSLRGDRSVQVQVSASYASRRLTRKEHVTGAAVAYAPGAIDWGRGMAQAAAWVTPHDPSVESIARIAARTVIEGPLADYPNRNVALMAAMVDALATIGVAYVPDPQNPFASVSEAPHAVDTIYYPSQTLERRTGDCDDTTVLLASLLANVGVPTRFVDAPGHIFLVAGTGLDENLAVGLGVDSTSYVTLDHELWLPLETTVTSRGFVEAWRTGASELESAAGADKFIDVGESQERYEPSIPPGAHNELHLDEARLGARLAADSRSLTAWRDSVAGPVRAPIATEAVVEIARIRMEAGDLAGARGRLESALAQAPRSVTLHNDLGVVLAGQDSLAASESQFQAALALGEAPAGVWLNLGFVRWLRGDSAVATEVLARGIQRAGGPEPAMGLLALSHPSTGGDVTGEGADRVARETLLHAFDVARRRPAATGGNLASLPRLAVLPSGTRRAGAPAGAALPTMLHWMP